MDDGDIVIAAADERRAIATYGLGGCIGVVVEFDGPQPGALVAHYSPMSIYANKHTDHFDKLLDKVKKHGKIIGALVVEPGFRDPESPTGVTGYSSEKTAIVASNILGRLGIETPLVTSGYLEIGQDTPNQENGVVIVEFPSSDQQPEIRVGGHKFLWPNRS